MHVLQEALRLQTAARGDLVALADARYEAMNGMFGGWTAAVLLLAGIESAGDRWTPSAITVNYLSKIEPGTEVLIRPRPLRSGRSIHHCSVEATDVSRGQDLARALLVLTDRRTTDGHTEPPAPPAPQPDALPEVHPPAPFGQLIDLRPVSGFPPFGLDTTESLAWLREKSNRAVDHVQLTLLADCQPPRPFYWSAGFRPSATLTLSVYFFATPAELAQVGDDYVLVESVGTRGSDSISGQQARLWSRGGHLLATTEQLCWYS